MLQDEQDVAAKRISNFEDEHRTDAVLIDFGYGWGRTCQLVSFGKALADPRRLNNRDEMFNSAKTWLKLGGVLDDHETAD